MQIIHQYFYHRGKTIAKAVVYTILSVLLVAFAVFSYIHWELSFMFSEWQGYVIVIVYFLITLGMILSAVENFKKWSMVNRGIPAFAVGDEHFVFYENGIASPVHFEDCDSVSFKRTYYRIRGSILRLKIKYHSKADPLATSTIEFDFTEFDRPQSEIDKQLKKVYNKYKKEHNIS